jgi:hypothetical protein
VPLLCRRPLRDKKIFDANPIVTDAIKCFKMLTVRVDDWKLQLSIALCQKAQGAGGKALINLDPPHPDRVTATEAPHGHHPQHCAHGLANTLMLPNRVDELEPGISLERHLDGLPNRGREFHPAELHEQRIIAYMPRIGPARR